MAKGEGISWTTGGSATIELPDPELVAAGLPVRVGDDLILIGPDGSRHVVADYFQMDPPPVLTAGPYRLPPEGVHLAAADTVATDAFATDAEQLAAAPKPRTVSAKAVEDFTNAVAQGRDFTTAVEDLAAAQIRQATARGVPLEVARKAAAAFANELALNLGNRMGVEAAIADAERGFAGAIKALTATDKVDPLLHALTTGQGVDGALSGLGLSGKRGAEALGNALGSGEQQGSAVGKGHSADQAHAKVAKSGNALMDALSGGQGLEQFTALLGDPNAAQRFAEMLQQGLSPDQAMAAARQAADTATQAQKAAAAASKGGLDALASGGGGGDAQLAQAMRQAGVDPGLPAATGRSTGGSSVMEALASGQGVAQVLGGGAASDRAFGNALAEGASIAQAQGAAERARTASGNTAADSTLGQIASGNARAVSGSGAFEAAVGEALARGTATGAAIGEASQRAALAQQASQKVEAATPSANAGGNPFAPSSSSSKSSPTVAPAVSTTTLGVPEPSNGAPSFVTQVTQSVQATTSQTIAGALAALQSQVAQYGGSFTAPPPPPPASRSDAPAKPNIPPTITVPSSATIAEDGTVTLAFTGSDSDGSITNVAVTTAEGTLVPASAVTLVRNGGSGTVTISPTANLFGTSSVTITVTDSAGAKAKGTIPITVTPVGDTVTVTGGTTEEDTSITLTLTRNAVDGAEIDHFRIGGITGGSLTTLAGGAIAEGGTVAVGADGTTQVRFTPGQNRNDSDDFVLTDVDFSFDVEGAVGTTGAGLSPVKASSTITVTAINDAPTAASKAIDVVRAQHTFTAAEFGFADVDTSNTPYAALHHVTVTGFSGNGTLKFNGTTVTQATVSAADLAAGKLVWQPNASLNGDDKAIVTFTVSDGALDSTAHTLTLSDAPLAIYGYAQSGFGTRTSATYFDDLVPNFGTSSQGSFTLTGVSGPVLSATLKITARDVDAFWGEWDYIYFNNTGHQLGRLQGTNNETSVTTFSVPAGWIENGTNTVLVKVTSFGGSTLLGQNWMGWYVDLDKAQLDIKVKPVTGATVEAFDLMGSTVTGGLVTVDARAIVTIATPGTYRMDFRILDPLNQVVKTASVPVTTTTANQKVVIEGSPTYNLTETTGKFEVQAALVSTDGQTIVYRTFQHTSGTGSDIGHTLPTVPSAAGIGTVIALLGHSDTNADQTMGYALVGTSTMFALVENNGVTELRVAGGLTAGSHTVIIRATDDTGLSVDKTFTVTVSQGNHAPELTVPATLTVTEDVAATFAADVSDQDSGDTVTKSAVALHGTATVLGNGAIQYTPDANYFGSDTITVTASDGVVGGTVTQTVAVTVNAVNDRPQVIGDATMTTNTTANPGTKLSEILNGLASDVEAGTSVGIGAWSNSTEGTWQYKNAEGEASWADLAATSEGAARLLGPDAMLRFVPNSGWDGSATLSFRGWDGSAGTAGGVADASSGDPFSDTIRTLTTSDQTPVVAVPATPPGVLGLMGWWDASDVDGDGTSEGAGEAGLSGGAVATWADKSGKGHNAAASGTGPALATGVAALGNQAALSFDGSNRLSTEAFALFSNPGQGLTVFTVFAASNVDGQHYLLNHGTGSNTNFELGIDDQNTGDGTFGLHRGSNNAVDTAAGAITASSFAIAATTVSSSATAVNFWINGTDQNERILGSGWTPYGSYSTLSKPLDIGARNIQGTSTYDAWFQGQVAELIVYDHELTASERQSVETYLSAKYGLAVGGSVASGPTYTENGAAVTVAPALVLSDSDNASLAGATVTITGNYAAGDTLAVTAALPTGVTTSYAAGTLTLAGTATVAEYQTLLRSVTFSSTSENPATAARTVTFAASDGIATSAATGATATVNVVAVNDAPTVTLASTGGAVRFDTSDGSNDYVTLTDAASTLDVGASGTLELWVRHDGWNTTADQSILDSGIGSTEDNALYLSLHKDVGLHFRYGGQGQSGNTYLNDLTSDTWAAGSWHHVAATWNDGALALYADGQLVDSYSPPVGSTPLVISNPVAAFTLGKAIGSTTDQTWANGMAVDDVRIWGSALSQADIVRDMTNTAGGGVPQGHWTFNEGTGTAAADSTGHYGNATLTNAAWTTRYIENGPAIAFMPPVTLGDVDGTTLTKATVTITGNFTEGDQLNFAAQNGISGSWNAASHALTLSSDTGLSHAAYKAALESVTFSSTSDNPTANGATTRTISIAVSDGGSVNGTSAAVTTTINVVGVNDAPSGTNATLVAYEDMSRLFRAADFAGSDPEGDAISSVRFSSLTGSGKLEQDIDGNGVWDQVNLATPYDVAVANLAKLRYTPATDASGNGLDTIAFQVGDDTDYDASPNTLTMNVLGVKEPPVLVDNALTVNRTDGDYVLGLIDDKGTTLDGNLSSAFTIEFEVKYNAISDGNGAFFQQNLMRLGHTAAGLDADTTRFVPYIGPAREFGMWVRGDEHVGSGAYLNSDQNYHLAITYNAGNLDFFLNGTRIKDVDVGAWSLDGSVNYLWVGSDLGGAIAAEATFDEVRIWDHVRSDAEISRDAFKEIAAPTSQSGLITYWKFDETSGTSVADSQGVGGAGTFYNTPSRVAQGSVSAAEAFHNATTSLGKLLELDNGTVPSGTYTLIGANGGATKAGAIGLSGADISYTAGSATGSDTVSYQLTDTSGAVHTGTFNVQVV